MLIREGYDLPGELLLPAISQCTHHPSVSRHPFRLAGAAGCDLDMLGTPAGGDLAGR